MDDSRPGDRDGSHADPDPLPKIDPDVVGWLARRDPDGCDRFFEYVYNHACDLIGQLLEDRAARVPGGGRRLIRAYHRDPLQIQAALLSAQTSFRRHLREPPGADAIQEDGQYVEALINVAYNRWQRQHYGDRRITGQAAVGGTSAADGDGPTFLEQLADPRPGPDQEAEARDFVEKVREEVHLFCKALRPGEEEVIHRRLFSGWTLDQIARDVNKSTATTHRICEQAKTHLRRRFRDLRG